MKTITLSIQSAVILVVQIEGFSNVVSNITDDAITFYCGTFTPSVQEIEKVARSITRVLEVDTRVSINSNGSLTIHY